MFFNNSRKHKGIITAVLFVFLLLQYSSAEIIDPNIEVNFRPSPIFFTSKPDDVTIENGHFNETIVWRVDSLSDDTYVLSKNGTEVETGPYTTNVDLEFNPGDYDLTVGIYEFTLVANDASNQQCEDIVIVTVVLAAITFDQVPVNTTMPRTTSLASELDYYMEWEISHQYDLPMNYNLYYDKGSLPIRLGDVVDGMVNLQVGTRTSPGEYSLTLIISDTEGRRYSHTHFLTVYEELVVPELLDYSGNQTVDIDESFDIFFYFQDNIAGQDYGLYANSDSNPTLVLLGEGSWDETDSYQPATFNLSITDISYNVTGNYHIHLYLSDHVGNDVWFNNTLTITVNDPSTESSETTSVSSETSTSSNTEGTDPTDTDEEDTPLSLMYIILPLIIITVIMYRKK